MSMSHTRDSIPQAARTAIASRRTPSAPSWSVNGSSASVNQPIARPWRNGSRADSVSDSRESRSIDFREADPWQLARKTVLLDEQIFIHGLSKILDNAVESAQKVTPESLPEPAGVLIDLDIRASALRLAISNVSPPQDAAKALETIRRGLLTGERDGARPRGRGLGLREARKSFRHLDIATEVRPGPPPFAVTVELLIPIAQGTNGRRA